MIYFTSDLHLGHRNALEFASRPFTNIDEMNSQLIRNINDTVEKNDELWILGDFSYRIPLEQAAVLRRQIQCSHVHLVYGNHDKNYDHSGIFQSVQHYKELKTEYGKIILFHFPIASWNLKRYGSVHLHGHIHSTGEYNEENCLKSQNEQTPTWQHRLYDVGVDANHYCPVSLDSIMNRFGIHKLNDPKTNESKE